MDVFIGVVFLAVAIGFGLKYRYEVCQWMNFDITAKGTKAYRVKELKRRIEDDENELEAIEAENKPG